jgi:acid phosphatase (class A)
VVAATALVPLRGAEEMAAPPGDAVQARPRYYLQAGKPDAVALLAPPPLPGSAEQDADMAEVVAVHKACTAEQTAIALSEKKFSVFNFRLAIGDFFRPEQLPRTAAFFGRVQRDAAAATDLAKSHWKRPRPYTLNPSLASGKLEKSFSYPSGHSTEAMVLALTLIEVFPDQRDAILAIGRDLGWHRVLLGRHYATDIYAGRTLAQAIVRELNANPDFRRDLKDAQGEIASLHAAALR